MAVQYTQEDIEREVARFADGRGLLQEVVTGMTKDQLQGRPVPGKWSMLECVCHMADFEPILAHRMKLMLSFDRPELVGIDEARYATGLHYGLRDIHNEVDIFVNTRDQMLNILKGLGPAEYARTGLHTELGDITFMSYLKGASGHIEHHMKHMNDKRQAYGLDAVPCAESRDYPAQGS